MPFGRIKYCGLFRGVTKRKKIQFAIIPPFSEFLYYCDQFFAPHTLVHFLIPQICIPDTFQRIGKSIQLSGIGNKILSALKGSQLRGMLQTNLKQIASFRVHSYRVFPSSYWRTKNVSPLNKQSFILLIIPPS